MYKTFRRLPVCSDNLELSWVVFLAADVRHIVQHRGMSFGTVSAVYAWHRAGSFLLTVVRRVFKAPGLRSHAILYNSPPLCLPLFRRLSRYSVLSCSNRSAAIVLCSSLSARSHIRYVWPVCSRCAPFALSLSLSIYLSSLSLDIYIYIYIYIYRCLCLQLSMCSS